MLTESGSGLGFRHPLIRAALYDNMPVPVRAAWHRDAGRALVEAGAPANRVARQPPWSAWPGRPARADGRLDAKLADPQRQQLIGRAPRVAAELLRRAVSSSPIGSPQHDWLVCRLADALYRVGDVAEAEQQHELNE